MMPLEELCSVSSRSRAFPIRIVTGADSSSPRHFFPCRSTSARERGTVIVAELRLFWKEKNHEKNGGGRNVEKGCLNGNRNVVVGNPRPPLPSSDEFDTRSYRTWQFTKVFAARFAPFGEGQALLLVKSRSRCPKDKALAALLASQGWVCITQGEGLFLGLFRIHGVISADKKTNEQWSSRSTESPSLLGSTDSRAERAPSFGSGYFFSWWSTAPAFRRFPIVVTRAPPKPCRLTITSSSTCLTVRFPSISFDLSPSPRPCPFPCLLLMKAFHSY